MCVSTKRWKTLRRPLRHYETSKKCSLDFFPTSPPFHLAVLLIDLVMLSAQERGGPHLSLDFHSSAPRDTQCPVTVLTEGVKEVNRRKGVLSDPKKAWLCL